MSEAIKNMRLASRVIGHEFFGTDVFIARAITYLAGFRAVEIINLLDSWEVRTSGTVSFGDTLQDALCGAVFSSEVERESQCDAIG